MKHGGAVTVLMYHSIGRVLDDWAWSNLTTPWEVFEDHLRWLQRGGYRSASLYEFDSHCRGEEPLPPRSVVLTFDDGYLDNWSHAAPLLERYGFSGTVVVTPEFVDPSGAVRPTLRDVWAGRTTEPELDVRAFMSWPELKAVSDAGILDVQCHAMTHTWYPTGDRIDGFHHPADHRYWLDWNAFPAEKTGYLKAPARSRVPLGTPVYESAKSLESPRSFPDPREAAHLCAFVEAQGGERLFDSPGWEGRLRAESEAWRRDHRSDTRQETVDERVQRIHVELRDSKQQIQAALGRPVDFLVWPGGGYDDTAMEIARELYCAVTVSTRERWQLYNRPGEAPGKIVRRGAPSIPVAGVPRYFGGRYLLQFVREFEGSISARRYRQAMKAACIAGARIGLWPGKG